MQDLNWKTWSVILLLAIGGTFEVIKRLPNRQAGEAWNLFEKGGENSGSPYAVKNTRRMPRPTAAPARPQAATPTDLRKFIDAHNPQATDFGHVKKGAEGKADAKVKKKKVKDDEWEIVTDP
nr:hypothetical protein [Bdellovibrionales bacterium]